MRLAPPFIGAVNVGEPAANAKLRQRFRKDIGATEPVRTETDANRLDALQRDAIETTALLRPLPAGRRRVLERVAGIVAVAGTDVKAFGERIPPDERAAMSPIDEVAPGPLLKIEDAAGVQVHQIGMVVHIDQRVTILGIDVRQQVVMVHRHVDRQAQLPDLLEEGRAGIWRSLSSPVIQVDGEVDFHRCSNLRMTQAHAAKAISSKVTWMIGSSIAVQSVGQVFAGFKNRGE